MTVPVTPRRSDTLGNDSTPNAAYTFSAKDKNDISVYLWQVSTGLQLPVLTVDVDYTVNGPFNIDAGGTITIINAALLNAGNIPTGDYVTILGNRPISQTTSYKNSGGYFPARHEGSYDDDTVVAQQLQEQLNRSLHFEETSQSPDAIIQGTISDGDVLQWDAAKGAFEPVQLPAGLIATPGTTVTGNIVDWGNVSGDQLSDSGVSSATVTANTAAAAAAQSTANTAVGDAAAAQSTANTADGKADTNTGLLAGVQLDGGGAGDEFLANDGNYKPLSLSRLITSPTSLLSWSTQQDNLSVPSSGIILFEVGNNNVDLTGIVPTGTGDVITLMRSESAGPVTGTLTLKDNSGSSTATNQFELQGDYVLSEDEDSVTIQYNNDSSKWNIIAHSKRIALTKSYASSGQTITAAAEVTLGNSLGDFPKVIFGYIRCISAEIGYGIGERVAVSLNVATTASTSRANSVQLLSNAIVVRFSDAGGAFLIANKTTGAATVIDNTKWELYLEAFA